MTRGFEPVCTNEEAREHFKSRGLTYKDITEGDILALTLMLNKEIKASNKKGETSVNTMSLSKKIDIKKNKDGSIRSCFLYLNSHYFTRREAISFNQDGFIGFAGWADDGNLNPLKRAFLTWCDQIESYREDGTEFVEDLPLVNPQPKTGYWINVNEGKWNTIPAYKCSECGANADLRDWSGESPFCPWCGAKMFDPQESEDDK